MGPHGRMSSQLSGIRTLGDSRCVPNWCDNRLAIRGAPELVMELVELVEGDGVFDFQRLVPMPDKIREGGAHQAGGLGNGLPGWYQWSVENWGVKWNAWDVTRRGYGRTGRVRYRFFTAYKPPWPVFNALA